MKSITKERKHCKINNELRRQLLLMNSHQFHIYAQVFVIYIVAIVYLFDFMQHTVQIKEMIENQNYINYR